MISLQFSVMLLILGESLCPLWQIIRAKRCNWRLLFLTNKPNFNISLTILNCFMKKRIEKFRRADIKLMLKKTKPNEPNLNNQAKSVRRIDWLRRQTFPVIWVLTAFCRVCFAADVGPRPYEPFVMTVTDSATGKGVPLVELTTVNKIPFYTDANGQIAFNEPGLMNVGEVYFRVAAPSGYKDLDADMFGNRGKTFKPTPGGKATFSLRRDTKSNTKSDTGKRQRFRLQHPYNVTAGTYEPFMITVKDADTGRGVPLVKLSTADELDFYTDSAGRIAFYEPVLMDTEVAFRVTSFGYALLNGRTATLKTTPGGAAELTIKRLNIAERLYRITGEGIYRDSVLLGRPVPLEKPLLSGKVVGQDTVAMTEYKGRLFWLWGDTDRPAYPLGNFKTSSATSLLPGAGGLDPGEGVNLTYYVDKKGFSKPMFPRKDANLVWMSSLMSVGDNGTERLVASYSAMKQGGVSFEKGMAVFNDKTETFETLARFEDDHHIIAESRAFKQGGYVYINCPYPTIRIKATLQSFSDPAGYEAFTCLTPGTGYAGKDSQLERDRRNRLVWDWKRNTSPLNDNQWDKLVKAGLVTEREAFNRLRDVKTGKPIKVAGGSAAYNAHKDCWVMVLGEKFGDSFLGEIWLAAAPAPQGPWKRACKIVTHHSDEEVYTFYNVQHHPEFNQDRGRYIYFEGTYVTTYSGNPNPTPRYDYNQMMYRLDLDDKRINRIWPSK